MTLERTLSGFVPSSVLQLRSASLCMYFYLWSQANFAPHLYKELIYDKRKGLRLCKEKKLKDVHCLGHIFLKSREVRYRTPHASAIFVFTWVDTGEGSEPLRLLYIPGTLLAGASREHMAYILL